MKIMPAVNQVEFNPFTQQKELRKVMAENNIFLEVECVKQKFFYRTPNNFLSYLQDTSSTMKAQINGKLFWE